MSLGGKGSKVQESKQDFLNRTRKEREEREAQRRREKAAERVQVGAPCLRPPPSPIHTQHKANSTQHMFLNVPLEERLSHLPQAFMVGRTSTWKRRSAEREGWDDSFNALVASLEPSPKVIEELLRRLLFFYRPREDDDGRLTRFGMWVVDHTGGGGSSILQLLRGDECAGLRCRRLCALALSRLRRTEGGGEEQVVDAALLLKLSDEMARGDAMGGGAPELVDFLVGQGLMQVLTVHLLRGGGSEHVRVMLCGLAARSLGAGGGRCSDEAWRGYVLEVLSSVTLSKHLTGRCRGVLEFPGMWGALLGAMSAETGLLGAVFTRGVDGAVTLLANIVEMSAARLSTCTAAETGAMAAAASAILDFVIEAREGDDDMEVDEEDDDDVQIERVERMMQVMCLGSSLHPPPSTLQTQKHLNVQREHTCAQTRTLMMHFLPSSLLRWTLLRGL